MTQHSRTTRLEHYINTIMPETHGHQRKAFGDFVAALLVVRTCCQATLARYFANFEAATRQLADRCQEIAQGLGAFGVVTHRLGSEELVQLWSSCLGAEAEMALHSALMPLPVVSGHRQKRAASDA